MVKIELKIIMGVILMGAIGVVGYIYWQKNNQIVPKVEKQPIITADTPFFLDIDALDAKNAIESNKDMVILEIGSGQNLQSLVHATSLKLSNLASSTEGIQKEKPILVYSEDDSSLEAADFLVKHGFTRVYRLENFREWLNKGYPVQKKDNFSNNNAGICSVEEECQ